MIDAAFFHPAVAEGAEAEAAVAEAVEEDKHEVEQSSSSDIDEPFDDCGGENMAQVLLNQEIENNKKALEGIDQ